MNIIIRRIAVICILLSMLAMVCACQPPVVQPPVDVTDAPTSVPTEDNEETPGTPEPTAEGPDETGDETAVPTETPVLTEAQVTATMPITDAPPTATPSVTVEQTSIPRLPSFNTTDLNGNAYSNSVFANANITMINIWATWCHPCIAELPDIQDVSENFASRGVQVIGVLLDSESDGSVNSALAILANAGVSFPCLRNNDSFKSAVIDQYNITAMPTTIFVDGNGGVLRVEVGSHRYSDWTVIINELLSEG